MSLINPAILYGLLLAAVPVVLHLLMRPRPKKLLFPALRLIQVRRKTNTRRMRLRHLWLLLLRVAVILLIVLAIARPSIPAANYAPNRGELIALAAIAAVAAAAYLAVVGLWRRRRVPNHVFLYRRALLRGGTGIAVVALALLLAAWPWQRRITAELSGPQQPQVADNIPVTGVFLFDTSLSMEYRLENRTRLEKAQEVARDYLGRLPQGSRIAVADSAAEGPVIFQADLTSARSRIDALRIQAAGRPLNERLRAALSLLEDDRRRTLESQESLPDDLRQDRFLREIYIFTDMAASDWRMSAARILREEMARLPWAQVYLIDLGVEEPTNVGLSSVHLSRQTVPAGGDLIVTATVEATGAAAASRTVELHVQNDQGSLVKQGQRTVSLDDGTAARVSFPVHGLSGQIRQGEVRLVGSDPLPIDDVRYFTVAVSPPPEVLVVAQSADESAPWRFALAPPGLVQRGRARYRVESVTPARFERLAPEELEKFDVVCLINVRAPSETAWGTLRRYVEQGGGLAVFLGNAGVPPATGGVNPAAYNGAAAQELLPAELFAVRSFEPPEALDVQDLSHPILRRFEEFGTGELTLVDVNRCWFVQPHADAGIVVRYTDARATPALLERIHGQGRTVMLTTGVDLRGWSDLPRAGPWFLALADQMMQYLARREEASYNYLAGDQPALALDRARRPSRYLLLKPNFQQVPGEVPPDADLLAIEDADQLGHYEVVSADDAGDFRSGFSVNPHPGESDFTRLTELDLDTLLGENRYRIARDIDALERIVGEGRIGQEVFPWILLLVLFAFSTEHLVANRFYDQEQSAEHS